MLSIEPVNQADAGPEWHVCRFTVDMIVSETEDALCEVDGVARGEWGVSPSLEIVGYPVSLIHLETGMRLGAFKNGARAMAVADFVSHRWPGLFRLPLDSARIGAVMSALVGLIEENKGRPL